MKPIALFGHERPITKIVYNREGDLLFTSSKDRKPCVWYTINGERLGTFNGHNGAVWSLDVDWHSTHLVTGSGDNTIRIWDCSTGTEIGKQEYTSGIRSCAFNYNGDKVAFSTDATYNKYSELFVIDTRITDNSFVNRSPVAVAQAKNSKITTLIWGPSDTSIITGHEDGTITQWDAATLREIRSLKAHTNSINDIQKNEDGTMFITASTDTSAKLFDIEDLNVMKTYTTEQPVNSASISPIEEHIVLGGGQEAMEVTTSSKSERFDARFYHLIFEEEFGRVKGHFGPINTLAFHPDGKSFSSGGEDGYVRINNFDPEYFNFTFEY